MLALEGTRNAFIVYDNSSITMSVICVALL